MFYYTLLATSTILVMSSNSWFVSWMALEINLMMMIPILSSSTLKSNSDSSVTYFMIQTFASIFFMFGILLNFMVSILKEYNFIKMIILLALLLKLGAAPMHFWFPSMMMKTSWINCMLLSTWQKIAPLSLILLVNSNLIIIPIILSSLIGAIGGFNQSSLKKIMSYSSIGHISWMLMSLMMDIKIIIIYFIIYSLISINIMWYFFLQSINKVSDVMKSKNSMSLMIFSMNMLSLGGIPPFLGFFPKWLILENMINLKPMLSMFLVMMSLTTLFFYLRLSYFTFLFFNPMKIKFLSYSMPFMLLTSMSLLLMPISLMFI